MFNDVFTINIVKINNNIYILLWTLMIPPLVQIHTFAEDNIIFFIYEIKSLKIVICADCALVTKKTDYYYHLGNII